ncbi:MAG: UDP-N-acetylmuramoyl-L-alanine--D-glutamate ligase [Chitinophagales bacterium]|jgi:UDP-N-acetylmuramoylalanine--D-glutamate ligase|nr:UDP-N-acetylmuramoyl-L-alanine--D-glutamate ligase [Bacteroidota bacterium]MBK7567773.1 UDP-N-acetylmuramoyl-L-alanine--D-glutamate ligase [Bacteroidota bacterium]MBP8917422.1 UDP-N-acetylmuramoyl-L-alanine--D-glutamate ligase [Chitinophagales bacterium]MBP9221764.1 UDP-N-acetylmuramoyl-L-alanine--D-glutamate ligase [Chitinophagales bacterium]
MTKRIVILGSGESGTGAAILAKRKGFDVFVSDKGVIKNVYKDKLLAENIEFEEGTHTYEKIFAADEIIKSPGIQEKYEVMKKVREHNIPVVGEIEFAWRYCSGKVIAITGSNGKSTCTALTYHLLQKAGMNVAMGGNIGKSFAELIANGDHEYYVLEISNFQLDDSVTFKPFISVLLNITPDHLDSYNYQFENYIASKFRIVKNQGAGDYFIYNADDAVIEQELIKPNYHKTITSLSAISFTLNDRSGEGGWISGDTLNIQLNQNQFNMTINELALQGKHNQYNSMAAAITGKALDIKNETIRESLMDFQGLEHRLEFVAKVHGISFVNDSKATNVNSTWFALESQNNPVIWIVGGIDKGNDYSHITDLVRKKVKAIVCLGADNTKIHEAFGKLVDILVNTESMKDCVEMAYRLGNNGDVVLLSPACASFDLFENFEDRGRQFKARVKEL